MNCRPCAMRAVECAHRFSPMLRRAVETQMAIINGTPGNDTLTGGNENDFINGLAGNDTLNGGAGADILDGGAGNDRMAGGANDDTYVVDSTKDVVIEGAKQGADAVQSSI